MPAAPAVVFSLASDQLPDLIRPTHTDGGRQAAERMFDIVILLAGAVERPVLRSLLLGHNPLLTVMAIETRDDLSALSFDVLSRARLIAFVTPEIVPANILVGLGYGAFNFHPGPPAYPGWAPSHFALYDQATEFGATAHVMVEQVDAGPIIDVELFSIPPDISVLGLEGLAYAHLALLFWRLAKLLATDRKAAPALADHTAPLNHLPSCLLADWPGFGTGWRLTR